MPRAVFLAAMTAAILLVASCSREPDHLPDIASDMATSHDIVLNHVAEQGGPARSFGPFDSSSASAAEEHLVLGGRDG
ncbi:hypothetical protein AB0M47_09030 [Hamadaea sp. NPDC051192]|uniref:hypothetical protein n=1 Tax=Hamadaea sp. NPDC051192 TaxID=3154940 RepID=UPI00341FCD7A